MTRDTTRQPPALTGPDPKQLPAVWRPAVDMVLRLPRDDRPRPDPKPERPYVLTSDVNVHRDVANLVYCTREDGEAIRHGAPFVCIKKGKGDFGASGLRDTTFVYPNRLIIDNPDDLPYASGRLMDSLGDLWPEKARALGLGTGQGGFRGFFVRLTRAAEGAFGTPIAVIITEPRYSQERRHQTIIPAYGSEGYDRVSGVRVSAPWATPLVGMSELVIMPCLAQAAWTPDDIAGAVTAPRMTVEELHALDLLFVARFPRLASP